MGEKSFFCSSGGEFGESQDHETVDTIRPAEVIEEALFLLGFAFRGLWLDVVYLFDDVLRVLFEELGCGYTEVPGELFQRFLGGCPVRSGIVTDGGVRETCAAGYFVYGDPVNFAFLIYEFVEEHVNNRIGSCGRWSQVCRSLLVVVDHVGSLVFSPGFLAAAVETRRRSFLLQHQTCRNLSLPFYP